MIDAWDKGPRDRTRKGAVLIHESADWINRIGPQVVIEVRDLKDDESKGVSYGELVVGGAELGHRVSLGPVLYGCGPYCDVKAVEDRGEALREHERRGREAARFMLECLGKVDR